MMIRFTNPVGWAIECNICGAWTRCYEVTRRMAWQTFYNAGWKRFFHRSSQSLISMCPTCVSKRQVCLTGSE